jgi:hypothetical protein
VWVTLSLEDNDLWDIVKEVPTPPIDPKKLISNKKREVKSKWTILNATNNHLSLMHKRRKYQRRFLVLWLVSREKI